MQNNAITCSSFSPKISVIIPLYNGADRIVKCLEELDNQTLEDDFEVIIVDDASTDNSVEIVSTCLHSLKHASYFRIIKCEKNGRAGKARNIGVNAAKAEYILFIDQDDYPDREMLKVLYDLTENSNIDCSACDMIDRDGKEYHRASGGRYIDLNTTDRIHYMARFGYTFAILIRRRLLIEHKLFFPENVMYEDALYNFGLLSVIQSINTTNRVLYYRTADPNSQTSYLTLKKLSDRVKATIYYLDKYEGEECFKDFIPLVKEFAFYFIYLSCTWWMLIQKELYDVAFFEYCYGIGKDLNVKWKNIYKSQHQFSKPKIAILHSIFVHPNSIVFWSNFLPFLRMIKKKMRFILDYFRKKFGL